MKMTPQSEVTYKVLDKLHDRSGLSKEMADLCANLPIYRVAQGDLADQTNADADFPEMPEDGTIYGHISYAMK